MFMEAMNESLEDENICGELNNNQLGNGILGPTDADRNHMTQLQESIVEEMWAARGSS